LPSPILGQAQRACTMVRPRSRSPSGSSLAHGT
jgi:hypothetical protein